MNLNDLPDDILKHIYEYADPETTWVADQVSKINVNSNGWIIGHNSDYPRFFTKQEYLDIIEAMELIPKFIKQSTRYNVRYDVESYGGKQVIEKAMKKYYISNGCFICSMILLGYQHKKPQSLNLNFKAKYIKN